MSTRTNRILLAVWIILLIVATYPWWSKRLNFWGQKRQAPPYNLSQFTPSNVSRIVIKKGDEEKVLEKKDGGWWIGEREADPEKVSAFFEDLHRLTFLEKVSRNPKNHANFGVTPEKGYVLVLQRGEERVTYLIGNLSPGGDNFYLRKEADKNVYLVSGNLRSWLLRPVKEWEKESPTPTSTEPTTQ